MNNYLIPANTKKSLLIFGVFNKFDLILFGTGIGITILLLLSLDMTLVANVVIALAPGLITGLLVFPLPNYHNIMNFLISAYKFMSERQKFIWKGWCYNDGEKK